jgi:hypothetical protein
VKQESEEGNKVRKFRKTVSASFLGGTGLGASVALLVTVVNPNYASIERIVTSMLFAVLFGVMTTYALMSAGSLNNLGGDSRNE